MLGLILNPLILLGIMYFVARDEAELDFLRVFLICLVASVISYAFSFLIGPFAILVYAFLLPWGLFHYCCLRWKMAFIVSGIFFAYQILFQMLLFFLIRS